MTAVERRILREMKHRGGGTIGQLVPRIGLSRDCVYKALCSLKGQGFAVERPANKGNAHVWGPA